MRLCTYVALLTGTASAQSVVTVLNLFLYQSTLTQIGADSTATTYKNDCPPNNAGISVIPEEMRPKSNDPDPRTARTTPTARLARQVPVSAVSTAVEISSDPSEPYYSLCEPFTIKQGPSTYSYHMEDPIPGAWTVDAHCNWKGALTAADLTCSWTQKGYATKRLGLSTSAGVDTIPQSEAATGGYFHAVKVIGGSGGASNTPARTTTGNLAMATGPSPSASLAVSSGASAAASAKSTGLAAAAPVPTGAIAFFGGAAGVLVAAIAL